MIAKMFASRNVLAFLLFVFVLGTAVNAGLFDHSNVLTLDDQSFDEKASICDTQLLSETVARLRFAAEKQHART